MYYRNISNIIGEIVVGWVPRAKIFGIQGSWVAQSRHLCHSTIRAEQRMHSTPLSVFNVVL